MRLVDTVLVYGAIVFLLAFGAFAIYTFANDDAERAQLPSRQTVPLYAPLAR